MNNKQMIKDAAMALSFANLCFIITWYELLDSPIRRPIAFLAASINVLSLAAIIWSAITLTRRSGSPSALRIARFFFPLVLLLPLNGFLRILLPKQKLVIELFIIGLAVMLIGMFETKLWHRIIRSASTLILILFPFFLITFFQSMWSLVYTPNKPLAPALALKNSPRVLWLLFDEMDQRLAFSKRPPTLNLPEFDRLRGQSLYATNAYPPADSTPVSMPAILTGKLLSKTELVNQSKLMITIADSAKTVSWSSQPNLFSQAREAGFNTTLIGWYIPYCSLIGDSLTSCSWQDTEATTLRESLSKQAESFVSTVPIVSAFVIANGLDAKKREERKKFLDSYLGTLGAAKRAVADPNSGLILVHWPIPHPPSIYNRRQDKFEIDAETSYVDNLLLADHALGELRQAMEETGTWDDTIVLVTSDHYWRPEIWRPTDGWTSEDDDMDTNDTDHRIPFILKLAGQKHTVTYDSVFNNVLIHDLILSLLHGEISEPDNVVSWLDQHRTIGESPYKFETTK